MPKRRTINFKRQRWHVVSAMPRPEATSMDHLNVASHAEFVATLGSVFENSPWVAERTWALSPFADVSALHDAMMAVVDGASAAEKLKLLRAHPELAGREAAAGVMTDASTSEQARLGLDRLAASEFARIARLNAAYRERFDFPCIVALRLHRSRETVFDEIEQRLANDRSDEIAHALDQIGHITRGRLNTLFGET